MRSPYIKSTLFYDLGHSFSVEFIRRIRMAWMRDISRVSYRKAGNQHSCAKRQCVNRINFMTTQIIWSDGIRIELAKRLPRRYLVPLGLLKAVKVMTHLLGYCNLKI